MSTSSEHAAPRPRRQPLFSRRYTLELRQQLAWPWQALILALALADRIGVMNSGRIVAQFDHPADRQAIGRAMVSHD